MVITGLDSHSQSEQINEIAEKINGIDVSGLFNGSSVVLDYSIGTDAEYFIHHNFYRSQVIGNHVTECPLLVNIGGTNGYVVFFYIDPDGLSHGSLTIYYASARIDYANHRLVYVDRGTLTI